MKKEKKVKMGWLKKYLIKKIIIGATIIVGIFVIVMGIRSFASFESRSTKIGFEDIGEFATQTAYCTELSITDKPKSLFGVTIPFIQSKYIYSYDIVIKAGFDFREINWEKKGTSIEVKLPEAKILSSEINLDSFKIYYENESIFNQITMQENNAALKNLKQNAEEDAISNNLLENARANAEIVLTGFFSKVYDLEKYKLIFKDK